MAVEELAARSFGAATNRAGTFGREA